MSAFARQFEPHVTRSGAMSKFHYSVRCSTCARFETYEATKAVGDQIVKGYFRDRGWLLGRGRADDLCPTCLAKPKSVPQPRKSLETSRSGLTSSGQTSERRAGTSDKRDQETADILARHLGRPAALAAEVFRPKEPQAARATPSTAQSQLIPVPQVSPEVIQAFVGLASDLRGLREAADVISRHLDRLIQIEAQQTEAIAGLGQLLHQSATQFAQGIQQIASTALPIRPVQDPPVEKIGVENLPRIELPVEQPAASPEIRPAKSPSPKRMARGRHPTVGSSTPHDAAVASESIVVKSIPDVNNAHRFYTSIRLPRDCWDAAGFEPNHRVVLDWDGQFLTVRRVTEGGVKPKVIGKTQVVLQSWKLGNLNLDQPHLDRHDSGFRLAPKA